MLGGTFVGVAVQRWLPDRHRTRDTVESIRLVITILVTFAALVLGLLVSSAKAEFDLHTNELRRFGIDLIELDARLREYGPEAGPMRVLLRRYTAAAIADTWPGEALPGGSYPVHLNPVLRGSIESGELSRMLTRLEEMVQGIEPASPLQGRIAARLRDRMLATTEQRWVLVEGAHPTISWPFLALLMLWLVVIFMIFGLSSPRNGLIYVVILLSAVSVSSSLYLILDLDSPLSGPLRVSSQPMRDALQHMDQ